MPNNEKNKPRKAAKPSKPVKRRASEGPQTLIIPQISPEMLESARRAASEGKSAQEIEQAALSGDGAATFRLTRSFCQDWEGWEAQLASLVQHHAIERIDESVARLLPLLAAGEEGGFLSELAVIRALSAHIRESELPYPKNLI